MFYVIKLQLCNYINANIKLIYGIIDNILLKKCQIKQSVNVENFFENSEGQNLICCDKLIIFAMMISINEHIEYLIGRHDCVVVPSWGAFIAQYQSAQFDETNGVMLPPMRTIGFNRDINHNDGLIAASIMRREKITYEAAVKIVNDEVDVMNHQFNIEGEISIGKLGVFRKSEDETVVFEPFASKIEYAGLPVLNIEEKQVEKEPEIKSNIVYIPVSRNFFKLAASIILLIGLGLTLSTPLIVDEAQMSYASISTPKIVVSDDVNPQFIEPAIDSELFISMPDVNEATAVVDTTMTIMPIGDALFAMRCSSADSFCLIVASLATRELAEEYIAERADVAMHILECDGRYRIYIATGATVAQAMKPMQSVAFAEKYPTAWVCRR